MRILPMLLLHLWLRTRNVLATLKHRQVFRCACWVRSASLLLSRRFGHNTAHRSVKGQANLMRFKHNFPMYGPSDLLYCYPAYHIQSSACWRSASCSGPRNARFFVLSSIAIMHGLSSLYIDNDCVGTTHPCSSLELTQGSFIHLAVSFSPCANDLRVSRTQKKRGYGGKARKQASKNGTGTKGTEFETGETGQGVEKGGCQGLQY